MMPQTISRESDTPLPGPTAQEAHADQENADTLSFITFGIGQEQYGVDIMAVREIKGWSEITHLPCQPDYMRGVLNLRGVMVPIIDLRCRFGQGVTEVSPLHIVIVVQIGARQVGILADCVLDIVSFNASQFQSVPHIAEPAHNDFLSGLMTIENDMIALIDLAHLLPASPAEGSDLGAGALPAVA